MFLYLFYYFIVFIALLLQWTAKLLSIAVLILGCLAYPLNEWSKAREAVSAPKREAVHAIMEVGTCINFMNEHLYFRLTADFNYLLCVPFVYVYTYLVI